MDEIAALFQEIEFHERLRGYDPDEVDAYVDRIARAASVLRGRLIELQQRVEAAEGRAGSGPSAAATESEETLTRTLVLAQRTADAAIAEAREEADRMTSDAATSAQAIVSAAEADAQATLREAQAEAAATIREAEDRAGRVLAEAETDRRTMLAEAESQAAHAAAGERDRLAAEVAELQEYRAFLADDIGILERHLTDQRHKLTASVAALHELLETPEAFRPAQPPETSGVEVDPERLTPVEATDLTDADAVEEESDAADDIEAADDIDAVAVEEESDAADVGDDLEFDDDLEPVGAPVFAPFDSSEPEVADDADDPAEETIDLVAAEFAESAEFASEPATETPADAPARFVTAADLEPSNAGSRLAFDDGGPATAPVPTIQETSLFSEPADVDVDVEADDDPFLSQLRDAMEGEYVPETDDDALTAFFDREEDDEGRSWFGRRR